MTFYRDFRPKNFEALVGQDSIKQTLINALKTNQLAHALLFTGPRGTGKTTSARLVAKAINCANKDNQIICNACDFCIGVDDGKLIDVIEIDAASNRGIEEIRDLREKVFYAPTRAKNKVYIIDEVHMLTKEAFNALLKTLEEPPENVYFILATTDIHKVPETVISRCQRYDFKRINDIAAIDRLKFVVQQKGLNVEEAALKLIIKQSRGGLRDALGLLEQLTVQGSLTLEQVKIALGKTDFELIENLVENILSGKTAECLKIISESFQKGVEFTQFGRDIVESLREKMHEAVFSNQNARSIIYAIECFEEANERLKFSFIQQLPFEIAAIKSTTLKFPDSKSAILEKNNSPESFSTQQTQISPQQQTEISQTSITQSQTSKPSPLPHQTINKSNSELSTLTSSLPETELTFSELMAQWSKLLEKITNPVIKRNLMVAKPTELIGRKLKLAFNDNFSREKLFQTAKIQEIETKLIELFNFKIELEGFVDSSFFATNKSKPTENTDSNLNSTDTDTEELINKALELFN